MINGGTIAVFGATGSQGNAFVKAALADKDLNFKIRGITRNLDSDKSKELKAQGVSIVQADLENIESLHKALDGCEYAFLVTDYWAVLSSAKEQQQIRNFIAAAKGLKHVVWSTLPDTRKVVKPNDDFPTISGNMFVPHFDSKGEADQWFIDAHIPTTLLNTAYFFENFYGFDEPRKDDSDGKFAFVNPCKENTKNLFISVLDIGKAAYRIIKGGDKYIGKYIGIYSEALTWPEVANAINKHTGANVKFQHIPASGYRAFPFPGAKEFGNMFHYMTLYEKEWLDLHDYELTKELIPDMILFDTWLEQNKDKFKQFH